MVMNLIPQLNAFRVEAGPAGLRDTEQRLSTAACLVVANMLMDPEFGQFIATGVHPASGWVQTGSMQERFAAQTSDMQRRVAGADSLAPSKSAWWNQAGISPWTAASQLSWTATRAAPPTRYNWYPAWRRRSHVFERLTLGLHTARPALLYVGTGWKPRHTMLVVRGDGTALSCYVPATGSLATVTRSQFTHRTLRVTDGSSPLFMVVGTGRRASF